SASATPTTRLTWASPMRGPSAAPRAVHRGPRHQRLNNQISTGSASHKARNQGYQQKNNGEQIASGCTIQVLQSLRKFGHAFKRLRKANEDGLSLKCARLGL